MELSATGGEISSIIPGRLLQRRKDDATRGGGCSGCWWQWGEKKLHTFCPPPRFLTPGMLLNRAIPDAGVCVCVCGQMTRGEGSGARVTVTWSQTQRCLSSSVLLVVIKNV